MAGALDENTAKTLASGRQTIGSVLSSAQQNLKKVFLVFVIGWLGTFYALRAFIWDRLKEDLVFFWLMCAVFGPRSISSFIGRAARWSSFSGASPEYVG